VLLILFYAIGKAFESLDWQIWDLTHRVLAGAALIEVANASNPLGTGVSPRRQPDIEPSGTQG
jgi:hypothetical protein